MLARLRTAARPRGHQLPRQALGKRARRGPPPPQEATVTVARCYRHTRYWLASCDDCRAAHRRVQK